MKIYLWLFIAIILIAALCVFSVSYVNRTVTDVLENLVQLEKAVDKGDWEKAYEQYLIGEEKWDKKNNLLHAFIEHRDLEEINVIFRRLDYQVISRNLFHVKISLAELDHYLRHLMENQEFSMGNIL